MRLGRSCKEGGRGGGRPSSCPEWPLAVRVLPGITPCLWASVSTPVSSCLWTAPLPSFPLQEQADSGSSSEPGSLSSSHGEPYRIDPWFPLCLGLAFSPQSSPGSLVPLLLASSLQFVRFSEDEASAKLVTSLHWSKPAPPHLTRCKVTVPPCGPSSPISFMGSGHQTRP